MRWCSLIWMPIWERGWILMRVFTWMVNLLLPYLRNPTWSRERRLGHQSHWQWNSLELTVQLAHASSVATKRYSQNPWKRMVCMVGPGCTVGFMCIRMSFIPRGCRPRRDELALIFRNLHWSQALLADNLLRDCARMGPVDGGRSDGWSMIER